MLALTSLNRINFLLISGPALGSARHRCRLCDAQPSGTLPLAVRRQPGHESRRTTGFDAEAVSTLGWVWSSMGGMLSMAVWLRQRLEARQIDRKRSDRHGALEHDCFRVSTVVPPLPPRDGCHHHRLVAVSARRLRDGQEQ